MSDRGIIAVGAYTPALRVAADEFADAWGSFQANGISEKAVPDADEDALTMAYEAARRALATADVDAHSLQALSLATTTPPLEEGSVVPRLAAMLDIHDATATRLYSGHTGVGVEAFVDTLDTDGPALVVASDAPRGTPDSDEEHGAGAGAAAFIITDDAPITLQDTAESAAPYPGTRFRERGETDVQGLGVTAYNRQSFVQTIVDAVDMLDAPNDPDAVAIQAPDGRLPYRAAQTLGADADLVKPYATVHTVGDTGAASVPLSLALALDDGATDVLAVGYGSGASATVVTLAGAGDVPVSRATDGTRSLTYSEYLRRRGDITSGEPAGGGAYISLPTWRRSLPQRYRLEAGRCPSCDTLNFPPDGACSSCHDLIDYDPVSLARTGTLEAVSTIAQGGAPPEFAEQQARSGAYATGIVAFDGPDGDTASAPMLVVDADPADVVVGDCVEATIRRIYTQEGVTRYGLKVRPA